MQISPISYYYPKYNSSKKVQEIKTDNSLVHDVVSFKGNKYNKTNSIKQPNKNIPKPANNNFLSEIKQLRENYPEFAKQIFYGQITNENGKKVPRFDKKSINKLIKMHKDEPVFVEKLVSLTDSYRDESVPRFDINQIEELYGKYKEAPEIVDGLIDSKWTNNQGKTFPRYNVSDINKIIEYYNHNPKFVSRLLSEKDRDYDGNEVPRCNKDDIGILVRLYDQNPKLTEKLLSKRTHNEKGIPCYINSAYSIDKAFEVYDIDPELTEKFIEEKAFDEFGNENTRFDGTDINRMVLAYCEAPKLTKRLMSDTITTEKGIKIPRFNAAQISDITDIYNDELTDKSYFRELLNEKTVQPDGKENFALDYNDIDTTFKNLDRAEKLHELKNPLKPTSKIFTNKEIVGIINDTKELLTPEQMDIFKDEKLLRTISNNKRADNKLNIYKLNTNLDGYQIHLTSHDGQKRTSIEFSIDNNQPVINGIERAKLNKNEILSSKEFSDGKRIVEKTTYKNCYMQSYMKTLYNSDGVRVRSEVLTPSKDIPGEYTLNVYERHKNGYTKDSVCSIRTFDTPNGVITRRRLTSADGTITRESKIIGKDHFGSVYSIVNKDGQELFHTKRSHKKINDNHYESNIDGKNYDIHYGDTSITVSRTNKKGDKTEKIVLENSIFDSGLSDLKKSLTGDYFFKIKEANIKHIELDKTLKKEEAFYNQFDDTITLSDTLKNDTFTFAHELGHAIDHKILNDLSMDSKLKSIWLKSLKEYKSTSDDIESNVISYFAMPIGNILGKSDPIRETIAETYALITGAMKKEGAEMLGTRSIILQQHFPEAIAYIANSIKDTENN